MSKAKYIWKDCKHHGFTEFILEGRGYYRCKKCRNDRTQESRKRQRQRAKDYKGGKCEVCGYSRCMAALEFHHLDPTKKDFGIAHKGLTKSWEAIKEEIDKCVLLCANCHREVHEGMIQL